MNRFPFMVCDCLNVSLFSLPAVCVVSDVCIVQAEEEGANVDLDSQRKGKCAVIKTSTRQVEKPRYSLGHKSLY